MWASIKRKMKNKPNALWIFKQFAKFAYNIDKSTVAFQYQKFKTILPPFKCWDPPRDPISETKKGRTTRALYYYIAEQTNLYINLRGRWFVRHTACWISKTGIIDYEVHPHAVRGILIFQGAKVELYSCLITQSARVRACLWEPGST